MNFWLPGPKAVVAGIGSRNISVAEWQLLAATGAWVLSHNGALRSGGAIGADTAWIGRADIHPARVTVCLPEAPASLSAVARQRLPTGIQLEGPPYPPWCEALAVAEWTFGERLCEVGLPPYTEPSVLAEFEARRGWRALRNRAVGAYIQQLMIRNARIIFPEEGRPVSERTEARVLYDDGALYIGVRLHDLHDELAMFAVPFDRYVERDDAAHVTISSWRRIDDNAVPARAKFTGAYINSAFIKTDAVRSGFDEALVLTNDGHISEGSAENVFMVRNDVLITPPVTDNILEGITRRTIMTLAQDELGLRVVERPVDRTEVYICDELFLTGTAAQVTAVTQVDHRPIADGVMGPVTGQLRQLYQDLVRGRLRKYRHWNEPVYVREPAAAR